MFQDFLANDMMKFKIDDSLNHHYNVTMSNLKETFVNGFDYYSYSF